jgi:hypothetical protein
MDGLTITGIILVTLGVMAMLPPMFAWSDGAELPFKSVAPSSIAQLAGVLVASRPGYDTAAVMLICVAWVAIAGVVYASPITAATFRS